jgi:DNA-binding MarR family transcriptional regulator
MFASCKERGIPPDVAPKQPSPGGARSDPVAAVLDASRALVAITVQSFAAVEDSADLAGIRALAFVAAHESVSLRDLADALGMHVSTASRLCDRLVARGLLDRRDDPADRRQLALRLTAAGGKVVDRMFAQRRTAVAAILDRMPGPQRDRLAEALLAFAAAAGEVTEPGRWLLR